MNLAEAIELLFTTKNNLKEQTVRTYKFNFNTICNDALMKKNVKKIKPSEIKQWLVNKQKEGVSYNTLNMYYTAFIKPAFEMLYEDDLIKKNPASFKLTTVIRSSVDTGRSLTEEETGIFMSYINRDITQCNNNRDLMLVILGFGLRASEAAGLLAEDVDLVNNEIHICKHLDMYQGEYYFETPKTKAGDRYIPISYGLRPMMERLVHDANRTCYVQGKTGFLFSNRKNMPLTRNTIYKRYCAITKNIDKEFGTNLSETYVHSLRHTFCTRLIKKGMNPKSVQYLMGHKNAGVTLNVYTHFNRIDIYDEYEQINESHT